MVDPYCFTLRTAFSLSFDVFIYAPTFQITTIPCISVHFSLRYHLPLHYHYTIAFTLTLGFTLTLTSLISNAVMVKFAYTLLLRYINVQIYSCYPHRLLISLNHFPFGTLILAAGL